MTKPHRLKWFRQQISKTIRRKEIGSYNVVDIFVEDNWKAQILFKTQFDLGLRYFTALKNKQYNYYVKFIYGDIAIYRKYYTEIRICNCYRQTCRGRFLVRKKSPMTVCLDEALRLKLVKTINEYYETIRQI